MQYSSLYLQSQSLDLELFKGYHRLTRTPCQFQSVCLEVLSVRIYVFAERCLLVAFSFCVSLHMYTSGKSMPSGWLDCAKSNVSPKYALATGSSLTITRPAPVVHGLCCSPLCVRLYPSFSGKGNILTVSQMEMIRCHFFSFRY